MRKNLINMFVFGGVGWFLSSNGVDMWQFGFVIGSMLIVQVNNAI